MRFCIFFIFDMSLVVHTIVRDGIVVSTDTRTTYKDGNGHTRYDDSAEKIIPFPNYIVVSHCGDSQITESLTVTEFLYKIRKSFGKKVTILELPLKILNEYIKQGGKGDTIFKISGYHECLFASTYTINTAESTITLSTKPCRYGASYNGITNIAHSIMNSGIDYRNLSITDAIDIVVRGTKPRFFRIAVSHITVNQAHTEALASSVLDLTRLCVETNIKISNYHSEQSIGGKCQTYVIDMMHDRIGWLQADGTIISDKNTPNNTIERMQN